MIILMEHPKHGRMHVYDSSEKARVEQWGWTEAKPKAEPAHIPVITAVQEAAQELVKATLDRAEERIQEQIKRKPGRPKKA